MIKGFHSVFICILSLILLAGPALAGTTLTVAVNTGRPPLEIKDGRGNLTGYEIDVLKAAAEEAGFRLTIADVPWYRIYRDLEAGTCDAVMASVSITDQKKEKFDFSVPYYTAEQVLIVRRDKAAGPFEGREVATFRMNAGADMFRKAHGCRMAVYTFDETDQVFRELLRGTLAGVLCDAPVGLNYVHAKGRFKNRLMVADKTVAGDLPAEDWGILVRKGDAGTLELINKGLRAAKDNGTEMKIREKWLEH